MEMHHHQQPLAFTIDFGSGTTNNETQEQRHTNKTLLMEKLHRRVQSLNKIETGGVVHPPPVPPLSDTLPRRTAPVPIIVNRFENDDEASTISDDGTYTLETDTSTTRTEPIFHLEDVSGRQKTEEYLNSLESGVRQLDLNGVANNTNFTKVLNDDHHLDRGSVVSVTTSGAFRTRNNSRARKLVKSAIQIEAYVDDKSTVVNLKPNLTTSIISVENITTDTESYLKPTQNYINALQRRLSLRHNEPTTNRKRLSLEHTRHNSLDRRQCQPHVTSQTSEYVKRSSSFSTNNNNCTNGKQTTIVRKSHSQLNIEEATTESSSEDDYLMRQTQAAATAVQRRKDLTTTRYNRAFSLRRARLDEPKCPNTPEVRRKLNVGPKSTATPTTSSRYLLSTKSHFSRTDSGRFSMKTTTGTNKKCAAPDKKSTNTNGRSNSTLSSREMEFQNWKRRKSYDPMKAAAEAKLNNSNNNNNQSSSKKKKGEIKSKTNVNLNLDCDNANSIVLRSQSFHGTAVHLDPLYISSEEEEEDDLTADGSFSPPTPSPSGFLSPTRSSIRNTLMGQRTIR